MDVAGYKDKSIVRGGKFKASHITIDRKAREEVSKKRKLQKPSLKPWQRTHYW